MDNISKYIRKSAHKWKMNEIKKLEQTKNSMLFAKISMSEINDYIQSEYNQIEMKYQEKLLGTVNKRYMNNQKKRDIDTIIRTKDELIKKGCAINFIDKYIANEYIQLDSKYNQSIVEFID